MKQWGRVYVWLSDEKNSSSVPLDLEYSRKSEGPRNVQITEYRVLFKNGSDLQSDHI